MADQIYLRGRLGGAIGPLPRMWLQLLYEGKIVDVGTPVSLDGTRYLPLGELSPMSGGLEAQPVRDPSPVAPAGAMATMDLSQAASLNGRVSPLKVMLSCALDRSTGNLDLRDGVDFVRLVYIEGRISIIETSIDELTLADYLVRVRACTPTHIQQGLTRAPSLGGDLGSALIALGVIQPHTYFEHFIAWAKSALGAVVGREFGAATFKSAKVLPPAVPLGLDRLGILMESVRVGMSAATLRSRVQPMLSRPLIPSQVEGIKLTDLSLQPRELGAVNAVDGVKTVGVLLDAFGSADDKQVAAMRMFCFGLQAGFWVLGEDPQVVKEQADAKRVKELIGAARRKNYFEILGITEQHSDDEVRTKYTDLAKKHHPDTLRQGAAPELISARSDLFGLITEAFEAVATSQQRFQYAQDLAQGLTGGSDELARVQNALHAETLFKKAEVLVRVRKYAEAIQHLEEAIHLSPDDAEFKIYLAYCTFLEAHSRGAALETAERSIRDIQAILKHEPNLASGYLFLGHLHKAVGKPDLAVRNFKRVLDFDPTNREAQSEIRVANMRQEKTRKK